MIKRIKTILKKEYFIREIVTLFIIIVSMLGFVLYESLALFVGAVEKESVASITTGTIDFTISSTNTSYNASTKQITVAASETIEMDMIVTNTTPVSAKYKFYYKMISPTTLTDGVNVSIISSSAENYDTGILETNKTVTKKITIKNTSTSSITVEIGVEGGYANNSLSLSSGNIALELINKYNDSSGANEPVLASGMIPVVYDNSNDVWVVADTTTKWYDYDTQWWANAVTVSDASLRTATPGTSLSMNVINSMWVWIPRYKYKITKNIGSSSEVTSPPQIDVVFETGTETTGTALASCSITATNCYYTHPAFRDGSSVYKTTAYDQGGWDKELEGIWVGKFETSGTGTTPTIKPNALAKADENVSNQFLTSLKFAGGTMNTSTGVVTFAGNSTYGLTSSTDTHLIKNTEWGAVAYLSQSKYGKMGNGNYTGTNKEVYMNNSNSYYTGRSFGAPSSTSSKPSGYGSYSYTDKLCPTTACLGNAVTYAGTGASTTGTIYGIYDMSGGAYDRTMGNWAGTIGSSGFSILPTIKYYDKYTGTANDTITSDKAIKGDATYETMWWYSDYVTYFVNTYQPWAARGGSAVQSPNTGIFASNCSNGDVGYIISSRSVLIP